MEPKKPVMTLVGEAKTPWMHKLEGYWRDTGKGGRTVMKDQFGTRLIALYMKTFELTYGFLTTYDYTIFVRQSTPEGNSETGLYISKPIPRSDHSPDSKRISTRQCLYYLLHLTNNPKNITNKNAVRLKGWVSDSAKKGGHDPITPSRQINTPQELVLHMSPAVSRITPRSDPIKLYRSSGGGLLVAILSFNKKQVERDNYVIINDKKIDVEIIGDDEANDSEGNVTYDDDDDDVDDSGKHRLGPSISKGFKTLNLQSGSNVSKKPPT
ncbi:hypothetical protein BDW62DRAFT_103409 [Aspergillus aurantiobrunneus]